MSKLLFMLFFCLVPMSFQYSRSSCPNPELRHGRVRGRPGARLARFVCNLHYELVGNKYATCRLGEWDVPLPVCVRAGCDDIELENGIAIPTHRGAWMAFYCFPGNKLVGSPSVYCDGYRWNATTPKCVPDTTSATQLSCDFESEGLCGWRQDELHDFDWSRLNTKTPSAFLFTGPSYDHTLGKGYSGYYMFIESTSKLTNESARLISPIYDGALAKNGCFSFFYHMYGKSIGGLRVYQIPEGFHQVYANHSWSEKQDYLLFEKWGDHGDFWFRNVSKLNDTAANFQIVIEGIRGSSFTSDIAIDDVAILQGVECDEAISTAVTPPEISETETCTGRCDIMGKSPGPPGRCGCSAACISDDNCCPDFFETCVFSSGPGSIDDFYSTTSSDQPLTEKLIRTPSRWTRLPTTSTTSTTSRPTTKTTTTTITPRAFPTRPFLTPRPFPTPRPARVTTITTSTKNIPSTTTTTRKPNRPTLVEAKTTPTRRTTSSIARLTTRPVTIRPSSTIRPRSNTTNTLQYNKTVLSTRATRVLHNATEAAKSRMEHAIQARKVAAEKTSSSSGSGATAAILSTLGLAACCVGVALSLRSARGRAALARMRGRAASDPEVRYLTRDDD